jgi:predicted protein tyrosine phosphatase
VTDGAPARKLRPQSGSIMSAIHVCSLSRIAATVEQSGASHLVSVINIGTPVPRPGSIASENHLFVGINDIVEPTEGLILPGAEHVRKLLDFVIAWDQSRPIVVHCFAGISRSTAAAFITLCATRPARDEAGLAMALRHASSIATPNARMVALADTLLGRNGRMIAAIEAIGRGEEAAENIPFALPLGD